ncbi:MAG: type IV pilin [Candidatus Aenigmarchaeota archaeon]|nr:type IV pilin [Candidatus Aenigmarchaeota archaeon]
MKGISPIVATVLLIAITMTIAGVLAYWASSFAQQRLPTINASTAGCDIAQFEFLDCRYNSSSQTVVFTLNNVKDITVGNLTAYIQYSNGTLLPPTGVSLNDSLQAGALRSYSVSSISSDFTQLLIKTGCPQLSRSNVCSR